MPLSLARSKEAASSNRERTCDRKESDNPFHSANNGGLRQFLQAARGTFGASHQKGAFGARCQHCATKMTTKCKTLSVLMTKISTATLIAISILTLHE